MPLTSVWHAGVDATDYSALQGDTEVDLAVIGGGLVGLTTALLAQRQGLRVAVLEARRIGSGTTGGTTGKVTAQHGARYAVLSRRHGEDGARLYAQANVAGMQQIAQLVEDLKLDCDLTTAPSIVYTRESDQRQSLAEEATAAQAANLPATFTTDTDLPFSVEAAVRFDDQLYVDPLRLVVGLANAFVVAGGQVFEHTRVHELDEHDDHVDSKAETATVRAAHVVVATLLPFGLIGGYFARTRPKRSFGLAARLRTAAPASMTISIDSPMQSTRPWLPAGPNGLIVVGGDHETGTKHDTATILPELVDWTRANFEVASIEHSWSAQDYSTPDLLPYIGVSPTSKHMLVATGFDKWGLSLGATAAGILVDHLAGRENRWAELFGAGRIGDAKAVAKLIGDNLKVGKDFIADHIGGDHTELSAVRPGEGRHVKVNGDVVGAYRTPEGDLHIVGSACTHMGCRLRWNSAETSWDCSCHGSRFDTDGTVLTGPATMPLPRT